MLDTNYCTIFTFHIFCYSGISEKSPVFELASKSVSPFLESDQSSKASSSRNDTSQKKLLKRKRNRNDEIDELLVKSLSSIQEKRTKEKTDDEEGYFGKHISETLRRFNARQKALAKLQIQQVLLQLEFPPELVSPTRSQFSPNPFTQPIPNNYYNGNDDSFQDINSVN